MKVDIYYASAGAGHQKIAEAIGDAFQKYTEKNIDIRLIDSLTLTSSVFQATYAPIYYYAVKNIPRVWGWFYDVLDNKIIDKFVRPVRGIVNRFHGKALLEDAKKRDADLIISTHFLTPELFGRAKRKGEIKSRLLTVITDFRSHMFWINPGTDHYWVMCEETVNDLVSASVPLNEITEGGIPVKSEFAKTGNRKQILEKFGFDEKRITVLLTCGSFGLGPQEKVLDEMCHFKDKLQCFMICGNNSDLEKKLLLKKYPFPIKVLGFIDFMADLMEASDLMFAKAGGSTTSEALAKGIPMIVMKPIPGQETRNAAVLKEHKASLFMNNPCEISGILTRIFEDSDFLGSLRKRIKMLAKEEAAKQLVEKVIKCLS